MASTASSSSTTRRPKTGDKFVGSFSIEDEIGKGSFATVYRGVHKQSGALVAIKSVNLAKLNKKLKDNLYSEIDILKTLQHPHIVALMDCRESPTHIHLVMEFCELGDLSLFIRKRDKLATNPATRDMAKKYPNPTVGGLNEVITRHFLKQLSSALEFLRERNYIHRDLKPQNLLLNPSQQFLATAPDAPLIMSASARSLIPVTGIPSLPMLKIADFGFARSLPSTSLAETLCGSPLYMAPEILRYEKYDAKADLWSVGTVLFEMTVGKPPFRASNHVELLRKIEQGEDVIRFPRDTSISADMKALIRALLKRNPVERMSFENFFGHNVIKEPIPGLVGEDRPKPRRQVSVSEGTPSSQAKVASQHQQGVSESATRPEVGTSASPRERVSRPTAPGTEVPSPPRTTPAGLVKPSSFPREEVPRRPAVVQANTTPNMHHVQEDPTLRRPEASPMVRARSQDTQSPGSSLIKEQQQPQTTRARRDDRLNEQERAAQEVAFERDYVVVEKQAVVVNAFADEMAASPNIVGNQPHASGPKSGQIVRRATTQGNPASPTGAVPAPSSRAMLIASGNKRADPSHQRGSSYDRRFSQSPGSATSAISRAIQGASLRLFGVGYSPQSFGKGHSPPQLYNAFPAYPTPQNISGLIEGKPSGPQEEDRLVMARIEESATRSDVVYGFAEVKFKQLVPMTPSMDHGLGGALADNGQLDDEGLTVDAIVALAEEALVLYVKALSILAKSMDIASAWWTRKNRGGILISGQSPRSSSTDVSARINSMVQWIRARFNDVLEKAEIVRLKLLDAQKQLPDDHPGHPSNHAASSNLVGASADGVFLSSGITAEKLMYDRALEMSRTAAINEIANDDLPGCEISYVTAINMLEAVLESDEENAGNNQNADTNDEINGINIDDRQAVQKVLAMIRNRLVTLRKKMSLIARHQSLPKPSSRPTSIHSGGTTPTVTSTPPK